MRTTGRRLDLSVCSIVKNEAANLPGLAACVPLARVEWIVLDTGSRDVTPELLREAGVEPHTFAWCDDFSAARNASLKLARRSWILWLDADDRLEENFWDDLAPLLDGPKRAYRFIVRSPRENSQGDRFRQIRLFPNHMGLVFEGRIHEQLGTSLMKNGVEAKDADLEILHTGYDSPSKRQAKLNRNRVLLEEERKHHPRDPAVVMEYGNCLYQSGEFAAAKAAYLSLLAFTEPPAQPPTKDGGTVTGMLPKTPTAHPASIIPIDEVLRHFPSLLGETCLKLEQTDEASDWFRLATIWNPSDLQPYYRLGKQALMLGNVAGALELCYAAIEMPVAVGRVANDNVTVRRNALGLIILCEIQLFGPQRAPRARECLRELLAGGLANFPIDYKTPFEFLRAAGADTEAESYARTYLARFPDDMGMWEDFGEHLFSLARHREVIALFSSQPGLCLRSGVLEAFRAKSLEETGGALEDVYGLYRDALRAFPDDPTLLVYFSDFVNHNKLYARFYADLRALKRPSETVRDFLRQMEAQGWDKP